MTKEQLTNIVKESLRDWFKKEKWVNIATGKPCGD